MVMTTKFAGMLNNLTYFEGADGLQLSGAISACLSSLAPAQALPPPQSEERLAFEWILDALEDERGHAYGVYRPAWLTAAALDALRKDAAQCRQLVTQHEVRHVQDHSLVGKNLARYAPIGAAAVSLTAGERFADWLTDSLWDLCGTTDQVPTEIAMTYIHYNKPGDFCRVHIDRADTFPFNCIVCLEHVIPQGAVSRSVLRLFIRKQEADIALSPGTCALFKAAVTPHCRTKLGPGEAVTLLSIGIKTASVTG
jgi:hypothetical protein